MLLFYQKTAGAFSVFRVFAERENNMKKTIFTVLLLLLTVTALCSCTGQPEESKESFLPASSAEESSEIPESSEESKEELLLETTVAKIMKGGSISVEADVKVETAGEETSVSEYAYSFAADKDNNCGMICIRRQGEPADHVIISGGTWYDLNDEEKVYTSKPFDGTIESFTKGYTTGLHLGVTDNLVFVGSGTSDDTLNTDGTAVGNLRYEKYSLGSVSEEVSDSDACVTYYFKNGEPYSEVMETSSGKTTFIFRSFGSAADTTVFAIPDDYSET